MAIKKHRQLPKLALKELMEMCGTLNEKFGESAAKTFERYLRLMDKYDWYFFSAPWPQKYDYTQATTFTQKDCFPFIHKGGAS